MCSETMSDDAELYTFVSVLLLLSVLGTSGNLVVLYVFSRQARHDRTPSGSSVSSTAVCPSASATVYIMALAAADLVICSLGIPSTVYMEWIEYKTRVDFFCKFYQVCCFTSLSLVE